MAATNRRTRTNAGRGLQRRSGWPLWLIDIDFDFDFLRRLPNSARGGSFALARRAFFLPSSSTAAVFLLLALTCGRGVLLSQFEAFPGLLGRRSGLRLVIICFGAQGTVFHGLLLVGHRLR